MSEPPMEERPSGALPMPPIQVGGRRRRGPALAVLAALLVTAAAVALWPTDAPDAVVTGEATEPVTEAAEGADTATVTPLVYEVVAGQTVRSVGDDLADLGVIDSTLRFRRVAEEAALATLLRPGTFLLRRGMTVEDAVDVLAAGPDVAVERPTARVQVIEGLLLDDTLDAIAGQLDHLTRSDLDAVITATREGTDGGLTLPDWWPDVTAAADGVDLLEGLLWPQTYEVFTDASARAVLQRLVDQTTVEMGRVADGDVEVLGTVRTRHELLTIASLIERETNVDAERTLVSGVIHGRLADGMRLDIDATLSYAKGDLTAIPLDVDRRSDSPYNTYRIPGLPPGPISGVGSASLAAAVAPDVTDARFYVLAPACDGSHEFAITFAEHTRNVAAFRAARDAGACT